MAVFEKAKLTSKWQITVPKRVREKLGLNKDDYVSFFVDDDGEINVANENNVRAMAKNKRKSTTIKKTEDKQNGQAKN